MALTKITSRILDSSGVTILGTIATGVWAATDIAVLHGGTGASTASAARTNLGLVIGTHVLAQRTFNDSNWDTAFGWGNHTGGGYVKTTTDQTIAGVKTFSSSVTVNGPRYLVQRSNDDSSIAFANNASGSPSSHTWAVGLNYSNSNAFTIAYGSSGIPSLESSKLVMTTGGEVGIGTTSPSATLHVNAPATTAPSLTMGASAGQIFENEDLEFAFGLNNSSPYNGWMQTRFNGNAARNFAMNPLGGNVGIGTNSPVKTLDVKGQLAISNSASSYWYLDRNDSSGNFDIINDSNQVKLTISSGGETTIKATSTSGLLLAQTGQSYYHNIRNQGDGLYIGADDGGQGGAGADMRFAVKGGEKMRITAGGEYSFGTPSGVTYGHGSNDGFHLRTGLELGFGNGNNNRPDFGINATGSGGGASLNIYCGEGSDDIDIQISPGAVMQFNSGGIKFGSSGELLNAYEEGTWTPAISTTGGSVSNAITPTGQYTIIGRQVVVSFQFRLSGSSGGSGTLKITNLPVAFAKSESLAGSARILDLGQIIVVGHYTSTNQIGMNKYDGAYAGTDYLTSGFVLYYTS